MKDGNVKVFGDEEAAMVAALMELGLTGKSAKALVAASLSGGHISRLAISGITGMQYPSVCLAVRDLKTRGYINGTVSEVVLVASLDDIARMLHVSETDRLDRALEFITASLGEKKHEVLSGE